VSTTEQTTPRSSTSAARPDPRVAVVVITHNRAETLGRTLARLRELPERPHVVVADNASSDGTAELLAARFPDVELLALERNLGAVARNRAVERLDTPYVAFCDDDTWWEPGSLRAAADALDRHPSLAVVNARIVVVRTGATDPICEEMAESPVPARDGQPGHPLLSFLGGAVVVRRSAFLAAGGFSSRLHLGGEEELLATDLATAGWTMSYLPHLTVHHDAAAREGHARRRVGIRNTLWFGWLRRPAFAALRRTVRLARTVPRDRVSLGGFLDALRGLPWVLRERRPVPPRVEADLRLLEPQQASSRARRYVS